MAIALPRGAPGGNNAAAPILDQPELEYEWNILLFFVSSS
jgi:hypothetical protein